MLGNKLIGYAGWPITTTNFFWVGQIFFAGEVSCRPGSDNAFYCDVLYNYF